MREDSIALFPDAVTTRGQKHIKELIRMKNQGHTAELVFVIQRTDIEKFKAAKEIDPEYARLLALAKKEGVKITPLVFEVSPTEIYLDSQIKFD